MSKQTCTSCKTNVGHFSLTCPQCNLPLPLQEVDPFQLFGSLPKFDLDMTALDQAYFTKQREVHPDRFVAADEDIRQRAAAWSTCLNEGYQTLKSPLTRARALYEALQGEAVADVSQSTELLQDMMELQEELMENATDGQEKVSEELQICFDGLTEAFSEDIDQVPSLIERYAYLKRLHGN